MGTCPSLPIPKRHAFEPSAPTPKINNRKKTWLPNSKRKPTLPRIDEEPLNLRQPNPEQKLINALAFINPQPHLD